MKEKGDRLLFSRNSDRRFSLRTVTQEMVNIVKKLPVPFFVPFFLLFTTDVVYAQQNGTHAGLFPYALHTGGNLTTSGITGTVSGDVCVSGKIDRKDDLILGDSVVEYCEADMLSVDLESYGALAEHKEAGDNKIFEEGQTYGGVWFVNGNATIKSGVTINGTIIVTGNIFMNAAKNVKILPQDSLPAIISAGNIYAEDLKDCQIKGLIFTEGNVILRNTSNNSFGPIVTGGNIEMFDGRGLSIYYDSALQSNPPPYFSVISFKDDQQGLD